MSEEKQRLSDYLREWGFDLGTFETRAKRSMETARGDLSEVSGALREVLGEARQIVSNLPKNGGPAASELKSGFEQAWQAIESAFGRARDRVREQKAPDAPGADAPTPEAPGPEEPPPPAE